MLDPLEGKEKSLAGPLCLMAGFFWFRSLSESNFIYCCFLFSPYSFLGTLYNITDMAWIGLLGSKAVAGVGVGGMFTWLSQGLAAMA